MNCSAIPGHNIVFSGNQFEFYPLNSKYSYTTTSILNIFEHYGYSQDDKKAKKKRSFIAMNVVSPKIDYQSYGKSKIDYSPFIEKVAELTVKACQGGGARALDGKTSRIQVVREILEKRKDQWYSWDATTRKSHWWTMSDVFYSVRKRLVQEEGYKEEEIGREYITGLIKTI